MLHDTKKKKMFCWVFLKTTTSADEGDKGSSFKGAEYLFYCLGIFFPPLSLFFLNA